MRGDVAGAFFEVEHHGAVGLEKAVAAEAYDRVLGLTERGRVGRRTTTGVW